MKKNEEFSRKSTHFLKSACLALCLVSYGGSAIYAASTYAEQTTLTVRMNNRTVKDVFSYIEKNSEFIFVCFILANDDLAVIDDILNVRSFKHLFQYGFNSLIIDIHIHLFIQIDV